MDPMIKNLLALPPVRSTLSEVAGTIAARDGNSAEISEADLQGEINDYDRNGDGLLNQDEFVKLVEDKLGMASMVGPTQSTAAELCADRTVVGGDKKLAAHERMRYLLRQSGGPSTQFGVSLRPTTRK